MENNYTAVEWVMREFIDWYISDKKKESLDSIYEKAKKMESDQLAKAYMDGRIEMIQTKNSDDYYRK